MSTTNLQTGEPCWHRTSEPVLVEDVEVARVCAACWVILPAHYHCIDCSWVTWRRACDVVPTYIPGERCEAHR